MATAMHENGMRLNSIQRPYTRNRQVAGRSFFGGLGTPSLKPADCNMENRRLLLQARV